MLTFIGKRDCSFLVWIHLINKLKQKKRYERKTDYLNEVKYFDNLNVPLNVESKTVSGEGVQKFPFAVQLPEHLPTSFENTNAKIIYSLSAILSNVPRYIFYAYISI